MHGVIRMDQQDFVLEEEFLFIRKIISMEADENVFIIDDFAPVIIAGNACLTVIDQGVGGKDGLVIDQPDIAVGISHFGIPVVTE